jgi:UDP-glucose:(heptosyl)LPS alpha-1,3-glucosyltransferase
VRIALVIEHFEPGAGGVENVAWRVAHGLRRAGDTVDVIARRAAPSSELRVRLVRAPALWQPLRVLAFSRGAARAAPRGSYDLVYSLARTVHQDVYRAGAGSHLDYMDRCYRGPGRALRRFSPRHAVLAGCERRVFADPTQIIQCGSEMVRAEIQRRHGVAPQRLAVVRNGVDLEGFRPDAPQSAALRAAWAGSAGPVWLFVAKGFARKGLDTALRAVAAGRARDARLWVVGPDAAGPWRRLAVRLGIAQRVRFAGPRRDLATIYPAADALLLPTRYDAFANVCLEAAAAGLPVVTSGANGAAELFREAGTVVEDPEDAAGFACALDALSEPQLRRPLAEAARALAEAHGWDAHLAALRALFERVRP